MKSALVTFTIFIASILSTGNALAEISGNQVRSLSAKTGETKNDGIGLWEVNASWYFVVRYGCFRDNLLDISEIFPGCKGFVALERLGDTTSDLNNESWRYYGRPKQDYTEKISIDGRTGTPSELFKLIANQREPVLTVENLDFKLQEFGIRLDAEKDKERSTTYIGIFLWLVIASVSFLAIVIGIKVVKHCLSKIPKISVSISNWVGKGASEYQKFQVRRVVQDEAIRQTTRSALASTSEEERAALRTQIKIAIDGGNHAVAKNLLSILQKMDEK